MEVVPLVRLMVQQLSYNKELVKHDEKKKNVTMYLRPSCHQLLMNFKYSHSFPDVEDALVEAVLEYNARRTATDDIPSDVDNYYRQPGKELTVAIASDPERELNKRKHKHGKSLMPERSKVFQVDSNDF
jgi:hypothetical protein